jgi:hypothetical protein
LRAYNILVFPCGSEIALEIHRSLQYSTHFNVIGASSVNDHGKFVYENYIGDIPFHDHKDFIPQLQEIVKTYKIDAIYPAMDLVALTLKKNESSLGCRVVGSSVMGNEICVSKAKTYEFFENTIPVPKIYKDTNSAVYPLFIKPIVGYGSRNTLKAFNQIQTEAFFENDKNVDDFLLCEYLSGDEYTIDCFSDRYGALRFSKTRRRNRVSNGISVNTIEDSKYQVLFTEYANKINDILKPRGAWFFQMKESQSKEPKLLEIAARLGGSSSLFRAKGVNFAMLSLFDAFDMDVQIVENAYSVELDRALTNRYKSDVFFKRVYVDYDDCMIISERVNTQLIAFLYKAINNGIKISLLTRHTGNLEKSLKKYRLSALFDEIIHIDKKEKKSDFIDSKDAIFIDDSFQEREDVFLRHNIAVYAPDMVEVLL